MENTLISALIITGIGMGLVFVLIVVLWGLMALLVRLTGTDSEEAEEGGEAGEAAESEAAAVEAAPASDLKRRAAAIAVAVALLAGGKKGGLVSQSPEAPVSTLSAWQTATRASRFQTSKPRGRVR